MLKRLLSVTLLALALMTAAWPREDEAPMPVLGQTWVEINGEVYGAEPDALGPIGGGPGYTRVVTSGQYTVKTLAELLSALAKAQAGETVFIDGAAVLDFTALVYAEKLVLKVPGGVTLASDRGANGSPGALLCSEAFQTWPLIEPMGENVRLTGLRLRGPDPQTRLDHHARAYETGREPKAAEDYYYALPNSDAVDTRHSGLEVDNCELSGWSHGAIQLVQGDRHHIHHNYIHHNRRHGLGYGVVLGSGHCVALIDHNVFDYNRHSIAATGKPGNAYEACDNVEFGHANGHYFDMHGSDPRADGRPIAGDWMKIHHNTCLDTGQVAVYVRGVPQELADIHHNWFAHIALDGPVRPWPAGGDTNVRCHDNAYGRGKPVVPPQ